jgi:membrane protease YdiL (CAAX protease family)
LTSPIAEEFIFRGYLYAVAKRHLGSHWGMAVTALLFTWIHQSITYPLPIFGLAYLSATAYELSGSIIVPIMIHAGYNAVNLLFFIR